MHRHDLADMSLSEIMARWPETVRVFVALGLHCVGCPIAGFHALSDAAQEHGIAQVTIERRLLETIGAAGPPSRRR